MSTTGEAGFLGRHLCDKFLAKKPKIADLDNFSTGSKTNSARHARRAFFIASLIDPLGSGRRAGLWQALGLQLKLHHHRTVITRHRHA